MWVLLSLLASAACSPAQPRTRTGQRRMLGEGSTETPRIPLTVTAALPSELLSAPGDDVSVQGRQALTVVYSRPLVPFGADWVNSTGPARVPFELSPPIDGAFEWVTTYIARFDPEDSWPPDQRFTLAWARNLTSWDGVELTGTLTVRS